MKLLQAMEGIVGEEFVSDAVRPPQLTPAYQGYLHDVVLAQQGARMQEQAALSQDALHTLGGSHEDLERVRDAVNTAVQDNQISTEAYLFADLAARASGMGRLELRMGPALESIGPGGVQVSTEGLGDFLKRIAEGLGDIAMRFAAELQRSLSFLVTRTNITKASLITLASNARHVPRANLQGVTVKANTRKLHRDGKMPENFKGYMLEVCSVLDYLSTRFNAETQNAIIANARGADALKTDDDEKFLATWSNLGSRWKDPRHQLSDAQLNLPMPGGRRLFIEGETAYKGDDATMKVLDWTINKYRVARINQQYTGVVDASGQADALSAEDVHAISSALIKSLNQMDRVRLWSEQWLAGMRTGTAVLTSLTSGAGLLYYALASNGLTVLTRSIATPSLPGGRRWPREISLLKRAMSTLAEMQYHAYFDACALLISVAGAFSSYGKNSIEKAGQLSS